MIHESAQGHQGAPLVVANELGQFLVAWEHEGKAKGKARPGIRARVFNRFGIAPQGETAVNVTEHDSMDLVNITRTW
jgi:hypothetical protein